MSGCYTILETVQNETIYTTFMVATCALCDTLHTAVSSTPQSAERLIARKSRKHVAQDHANDPRRNYDAGQRLLCAIFNVQNLADIPRDERGNIPPNNQEG